MRKLTIINCLAFCTLLNSACLAQSYHYRALNDGLSLTTLENPYGITVDGTILIQELTPDAENGPGYLYRYGKLGQLQGSPGDGFYGLNDFKTVVGSTATGTGFVQDSKGHRVTIGAPATDFLDPYAINDLGVVVGADYPASGGGYGFFWKNGKFTTYTYPSSSFCSINGINNLGDFVGTYTPTDDPSASYGFLVHNGKATQLSAPGYDSTAPYGINDLGVIAGTAQSSTVGGSVAFIVDGRGNYTFLDYTDHAPSSVVGPDGQTYYRGSTYNYTSAYALNDLGQVVGEYSSAYETVGGTDFLVVSISFVADPDRP